MSTLPSLSPKIKSRFLNVIGLFNGFIPLVAIQMQADKISDQVALVYTTVLNQMKLGMVDEEEEVAEAEQRRHSEARGTAERVAANGICTICQMIDSARLAM
jgi:hypothetical protein